MGNSSRIATFDIAKALVLLMVVGGHLVGNGIVANCNEWCDPYFANFKDGVSAVDMNSMERVLLDYTDNVGVLTYSTTMVPRRLISIKYFIRHPVIPSWLIPTRGYGINGEYGSLRRNWDGFESRYLHQREREIVAD